jgi:predicted metal-binding protein
LKESCCMHGIARDTSSARVLERALVTTRGTPLLHERLRQIRCNMGVCMRYGMRHECRPNLGQITQCWPS